MCSLRRVGERHTGLHEFLSDLGLFWGESGVDECVLEIPWSRCLDSARYAEGLCIGRAHELGAPCDVVAFNPKVVGQCLQRRPWPVRRVFTAGAQQRVGVANKRGDRCENLAHVACGVVVFIDERVGVFNMHANN